MKFVEMYEEMESMKESETVSETDNTADTVSVTDSKIVKTKGWDKVAENGNEAVNVLDTVNLFDSVNVLENVFDSVNASADGRHSSIIVPLYIFKLPNVSFWYVPKVITDAAGTPEKAFDETVGDISP